MDLNAAFPETVYGFVQLAEQNGASESRPLPNCSGIKVHGTVHEIASDHVMIVM